MVLNGGHAEPVIGRAFARPGGFAHPTKSARAYSAATGEGLWTYDTYLHGLPFYAHRPVDKILQFTGEFHYAKRDPAYVARFGEEADLKSLPLPGRRTFVAMRSRERARFIVALGQAAASVESSRDFGPWSLVVLRAR